MVRLMILKMIFQEIRNLEGELIKLFGNQLATKAALSRASSSSSSSSSSTSSELDSYPSVEQWLRVVGVSENLLDYILKSNKKWTLEGLLESSVGVREVHQKDTRDALSLP